jgi:amidase
MERAFFELWADGTAWSIESWSRRVGREPTAEELEPLTCALRDIGRQRTAADHLLTVEHLQAQARKASSFFQDYDAWLTPTVAQPPPPLGAFEPPSGEPIEALALDGRFSPFTYFANVTGQPAMSVPLAWSPDNLPIGVHFIGRFCGDAVLFRLAAQLEEARPWNQRVPPTCALTM